MNIKAECLLVSWGLMTALLLVYLFVGCSSVPPEDAGGHDLPPPSMWAEVAPSGYEIRKAKDQYRRMHPECSACGATTSFGTGGNAVDVHHVEPVSEAPHLAADTNNLISFCKFDHWNLGHCAKSYKHHNPRVREAAEEIRIVRDGWKEFCTRGEQ